MSSDHTKIILDSIADGVFTIDRDRSITSFNRAAERITGVARDQAIGQKCFDVFRASICQGSCALENAIETGQEMIDARIDILNVAGETVPVSISAAALKDESGEVVGGVETFRDLSAIELLRKEIRGRYTFHDIISKSHEIQRIFDIMPDIATSESTVLIEGPSGSGKELFARAIHDLSQRSGGPFVVVNCGALPDTLLESELFGYVKGAFTGAEKDKPGRFARAKGGTIFLDEIGDTTPALQVKLLRVLQEKEYEPLGSTETSKSDVRVIAATNRKLSALVSDGSFREDLFYRLNVVRIELPPLAERRGDIPLLVDHFIRNFAAEKGKAVESVSAEALDILMRHDFPGNIRELENAIEHAFVLCRSAEIQPECLPSELVERASVPRSRQGSPIEEAEAEAIRQALAGHDGNRRAAAAELGIHKTTLWRKMKKHGIS